MSKTDYTDKTDAELDALAAERMWINEWTDYARDYDGPFPMFVNVCGEISVYLNEGDPTHPCWSPTTDANDRDEWVGWLRAQGYLVSLDTLESGECWASIRFADMGFRDSCGASLEFAFGRAAVIAGLRATDE